MFWTNYLLLCAQENKSPNGLAKELGISSGTVTGWKKGKIPSEASLQKVADYFGLTKWDLLGTKNPATNGDGSSKSSSKNELNDYANSLFAQLPIDKKILLISRMQAELRGESVQDGP